MCVTAIRVRAVRAMSVSARPVTVANMEMAAVSTGSTVGAVPSAAPASPKATKRHGSEANGT